MLFKGWQTPGDAFEEWKRVSKDQLCDYSGITYELLEEEGGIQWPCNVQNPKGTKRLYSEDIAFRTTDQKAKLLSLDWYPMDENLSEAFPVMLNTGRTVEQWHTRTKTRSIAILDNLAPEAWVEINPSDADKLKVNSGDRLTLSSARGKVKDIVVKVTQNMAPGQVFVPFHFNTQLINQLTQPLFCPKSGEPNYKQTAVQLHSQKVPAGIKVQDQEISGALAHENVLDSSQKLKVKEKKA